MCWGRRRPCPVDRPLIPPSRTPRKWDNCRRLWRCIAVGNCPSARCRDLLPIMTGRRGRVAISRVNTVRGELKGQGRRPVSATLVYARGTRKGRTGQAPRTSRRRFPSSRGRQAAARQRSRPQGLRRGEGGSSARSSCSWRHHSSSGGKGKRACLPTDRGCAWARPDRGEKRRPARRWIVPLNAGKTGACSKYARIRKQGVFPGDLWGALANV